MAQNYTDDCFGSSHVGQTDLQNMENNFACLKSCFSGLSAPSNAVAGMWWYDTTNNVLKLRNKDNNAWLDVYDFGNQWTVMKTSNIKDGALTADSAGRAKMADLYVTNGKINDVSWHSISTMDGTPLPVIDAVSGGALTAHTLINNLASDGGTYRPFMWWHVYIPSGAKYLVLGIRGACTSATFYVRMNVNGTTGGTVSVSGTGIGGFNGAALDISAQAGAWRYLYLEGVLSASSVARLQSVVIQWYGA